MVVKKRIPAELLMKPFVTSGQFVRVSDMLRSQIQNGLIQIGIERHHGLIYVP